MEGQVVKFPQVLDRNAELGQDKDGARVHGEAIHARRVERPAENANRLDNDLVTRRILGFESESHSRDLREGGQVTGADGRLERRDQRRACQVERGRAQGPGHS